MDRSISRTLSPDFSLVVVQLTDTHLFADPGQEMRGCRTRDTLAQVLKQVAALPQLDLLLLTGDLSQDDSPESYQHLRQAIAPFNVPAYWLPGNHDQNVRATEALLGRSPFSHTKSFAAGGWRFLLLSTMQPQQVQGRLTTDTLAWLEAELSAHAEQPTLVALHHHPLPIESAWMDAIALENPEDLFQVLDRHKQVKLVLNGHIHQAFEGERNQVKYLGTPSTCIQFAVCSPQMVMDEDQPPGFRRLELFPNGSYRTDVIRLPSGNR